MVDNRQDHGVLLQVWAIRSVLSGQSFSWKQHYVLEFDETLDGEHSVLLVTVRESSTMLSPEVPSTFFSAQTSEISSIRAQPTRSVTLPSSSEECSENLVRRHLAQKAERRRNPLKPGDWDLSDDDKPESKDKGEESRSLLSRSTC
jgi:hypothetical protein